MINQMVGYMIDEYVRMMLNLYFAPYYVIGKSDEVGEWVSSFSTNGMKWANICNPR